MGRAWGVELRAAMLGDALVGVCQDRLTPGEVVGHSCATDDGAVLHNVERGPG